MNPLFDLFPRTRAEILRLLFESGDQEIHLRDLARLAGLSPAALQKELTSFAAKEFVLTRRDGNRLYYRANIAHPLYPELRGIVLKTTGVAAELARALSSVEGVDISLIFGSVAAGTATGRSDVDLLVIGNTGLRKITPSLRGVAETLGREAGNTAKAGTAHREIVELIEIRQKASDSRKKFKEHLIANMSQWTTEVPASWSVESVSAFAECLDSARVPVKRDKRASAKGLYPYYGANGEVDRVDDYLFDDELVLVTEDETFYGREKPIAYRSSGKCWVNNHAHVLKAADIVSSDYLCYSLMHYEIIPWLTGTTGRAKLTQGVLNALPIAVPPKTEMVEIARRVKDLLTFADLIEARLATAQKTVERLTPATLAKAFRGELVPQDPNDEPASVLLERLGSIGPGKLTI